MHASRFLGRHRSLFLNLGLIAMAVGVFAGIKALTPEPAVADPAEKVCICHATGREPSLHFVDVCASRNAIFGNAGHFFEHGTPRAGHEHDKLGPCEETEPSPSPSATP